MTSNIQQVLVLVACSIYFKYLKGSKINEIHITDISDCQ